MSRLILISEICAVMLLAAVIYVFAPTVKSEIEAKWMRHPQPQTITQAAPAPKPTAAAQQTAPQAIPKAPKISPAVHRTVVAKDDDSGAGGPPDHGSLRAASVPLELQQQQQSPKISRKTIAFMPGQAKNFTNRIFRKIEIRSDYPIRVLTGQCHNDYTVQFFCEGDPADVFITDTRHFPIFATPRANNITITAREF